MGTVLVVYYPDQIMYFILTIVSDSRFIYFRLYLVQGLQRVAYVEPIENTPFSLCRYIVLRTIEIVVSMFVMIASGSKRL